MLKQHYKSVVFLLSVHMLSVLNMLLRLMHTVSDTVWLFGMLVLCLLAVPSYFFVKGSSPQKWSYLLCSVVSHIVFSALVLLVLGNLFEGWDTLLTYYTELFLSAALGLAFAIDCALTLKAKIGLK